MVSLKEQIKSPKRETLSLCLIFKDEEKFLSDAVLSVLAVCDECILVDSGSQDESIKVVRQLENLSSKVKYFLREWPGDFSNQKNFALGQARSDWILFLDADERLVPEDLLKIQTALQDPSVFAYELPIFNYTDDFTEIGYQPTPTTFLNTGYVETRLYRLFRRDSRIRYRGILHERIEPSLSENSLKTKILEVPIHHLGKLKEKQMRLQEKRYAFYGDLAQKKIRENPSDAQAYWEWGVVLQKQARYPEAESSFKKALELLPTSEELETYYLLSLFQQKKFDEILSIQPQFFRGKFFSILVRAYKDPKMIDELEDFIPYFSQTPLLLYELSLLHRRTDRVETDRQRALQIFPERGIIEGIEGSVARRNGDLPVAIAKLQLAFSKGFHSAFHDLILSLSQQKMFSKVFETYKQLDETERVSLSKDTRTVLQYAAAQTGYSWDEKKTEL